MSATPSVSVIVIFHDEAAYLQEAVESVRQQSLEDWELLLVDDGSTDASTAIARELSRQDPARIAYLDHPGHTNQGMSASRNLGLAAARGRHVAFLDADDVYLPERLARHVRVLDARPDVDMVQSEAIFWLTAARAGAPPRDDVLRRCVWPYGVVLEPPQALVTLLAAPLLYTGVCNVTLRRHTATGLGGFETSFRSLYEDQVFLTKVYLEHRVYALGDFLARVRIHPRSCTYAASRTAHRADGPFQTETRRFLAWRLRYIRSRGVADPLLARALADLERARGRVPVRGAAVMLRGLVLDAVRRGLPDPLYRGVFRWYRRAVARWTEARYRRLRRSALALGVRWPASGEADAEGVAP